MLALPLGERDFATVSVERRSNPSETNALLNVSRNLLETDSFGYRVLAGEQSDAKRLELGAFWRTGVGEFGVEAADSFDVRATRAYARGGIAAAGGEWRISRYLDQSFAMVKVADFPDVRVYANSQPVGKTDASGVAVIPRLSGFLPNTITFEAEDIPLEGSFGENAKQVKIANRMGALVDMGVLRRLSATLTLMEASGRPVPAGASARIGEAEEEFPVARQGRVYVSGLERGKPNVLQVRIGERACRATVELPDGFRLGVHAGVLYVPMTRFVLAACCALLPLSAWAQLSGPESRRRRIVPGASGGLPDQCAGLRFRPRADDTEPRRRSMGNNTAQRHVHPVATGGWSQRRCRRHLAEGDTRRAEPLHARQPTSNI